MNFRTEYVKKDFINLYSYYWKGSTDREFAKALNEICPNNYTSKKVKEWKMGKSISNEDAEVIDKAFEKREHEIERNHIEGATKRFLERMDYKNKLIDINQNDDGKVLTQTEEQNKEDIKGIWLSTLKDNKTTNEIGWDLSIHFVPSGKVALRIKTQLVNLYKKQEDRFWFDISLGEEIAVKIVTPKQEGFSLNLGRYRTSHYYFSNENHISYLKGYVGKYKFDRAIENILYFKKEKE